MSIESKGSTIGVIESKPGETVEDFAERLIKSVQKNLHDARGVYDGISLEVVYGIVTSKEDIALLLQQRKASHGKSIEDDRKNAQEREYSPRYLDDVVDKLIEDRKKGLSTYIDFNGKRLYSVDIYSADPRRHYKSIDYAYRVVTGRTKAEYGREVGDWAVNNKVQEIKDKMLARQAEYQISKWMEVGETLIEAGKLDSWKEFLEKNKDLYRGLVVENAIEIIKKLKDGASLEEAQAVLDNQGHSGPSYNGVALAVRDFSNRGQDFFDLVYPPSK